MIKVLVPLFCFPCAALTIAAAAPQSSTPDSVVMKLRIRGSLRAVELTTDKVYVRHKNGTGAILPLPGKHTLEETAREAVRMERYSGERADLIAWPAERSRNEQDRMLITKRVLVVLASGVSPSVFLQTSGALAARRPGYAPDSLILTYSDAAESIAAVERLSSLPGVLRAENIIAVQRHPEFVPKDPYFTGGGPLYSPPAKADNINTPTPTGLTTAAYQWWARNVPAGSGPRNAPPARTVFGDFPPVAGQMADLRLTSAWDINGPEGNPVTGAGVIVTVIDDGIDKNNPDLAPALLPLEEEHHNFFTGANSPGPVDPSTDTHGSSVAGIIAAGRNDAGISGIAPGSRLHSLVAIAEFLDDDKWAQAFAWGTSLTDTDGDMNLLDETLTGDTVSDICVNASSSSGSGDATGLFPESWLWKRAVRYSATKGRAGKGVVFVTSSGNGGDGHMNTNYAEEKSYLYQIPVAGVSDLGRRIARSNPGANIVCAAPTWGDELPPVLNWTSRPANFPSDRPIVKNPPIEPDDLRFTWRRTTQGIPTTSTGTKYDFNFSGTSASAAQVAGIVALMLELRPDLTARDVKEILLRSGRVTNDVRFGTNNLPLPYEPNGPGSAAQQVYPWPAGGPHPPLTMAEGPTQWRMSSLGRPMHHAFGAGLIDANKALKIAKRWTLLPANPLPPVTIRDPFVEDFSSVTRRNSETGGLYLAVPYQVLIPTNGNALELVMPAPPAGMRLEHVEVRVQFYHKRRGDLEIKFVAPPESSWHNPRSEEPGGNSRGRSMVSDLYIPHRNDYTESPWHNTDVSLRDPTDWTFTTVRHWGSFATQGGGPWKLVIRDAITKGRTTQPNVSDPIFVPVDNPTDAASQRLTGAAVTYHGTFPVKTANDPPVIAPAALNFIEGGGVSHAAVPVEPLANGPDGTVAYPVLSWDFFNLSDIVPVQPTAPPRSPFEYFPPGSNTAPGTPPAQALYPNRADWPAVPATVALDPAVPAPPPDEPASVLVSLPGWLEFSADGKFVVLRDASNPDSLTNFIHVRLNRALGILDVVPLHPGLYGINVIAENLTGISRPRRVSISVWPPPPASYGEWLSAHFTPDEISNPAISGPNADLDDDGFNNRLEYAFLSDPRNASTARTPAGEFLEIDGRTYASLRFTRNSAAADLNYSVQFSNELLTWKLPAVPVSSNGNGDGTRTEVWRSAGAIGARARIFGRVLVSPNP